MLVRSSIRGNVEAANFRGLSQVKKRYVTSESSAGIAWHTGGGRLGGSAKGGSLIPVTSISGARAKEIKLPEP
jgi:hypothetical protein